MLQLFKKKYLPHLSANKKKCDRFRPHLFKNFVYLDNPNV